MPINNITQTISELPAAGRRGVDVQTQFVIKQEDFQDHLQGITVTELNTLKGQLNSRIGEINSTVTTMNGYVNDAFAGSSTATTKAGEASTSATAALNSKNQASTFATNSSNSATKSSQWADNNYNVAVETGKYSAKHWSTVAQNATVNKVDKVTSTDNAVVRFDGTTGAVQNSSVIINDNGNLLLGTTTDNGVDKLQVNGSISNVHLYRTISDGSANTGEYTKTTANGNGAAIFASVFGDIPTIGELYAEEIGTSNYLVASVYKRGIADAPSVTIQAFNGLGFAIANDQGTITLNGFTNIGNVRMLSKIRKIY